MLRIFFITVLCLCISANLYAQAPKQQVSNNLLERVLTAPESVFKKFKEAGMDPSNHDLTAIDKTKVEKAFAALPPLHQKVLQEHLHSISFMDNMPNTALASPVETPDSTKMFNITFRAGILNETISEWATQKEYTCYDQSVNPDYSIKIEAGKLDAILYVLLHEATHVVDALREITPNLVYKEILVKRTAFTKNVI